MPRTRLHGLLASLLVATLALAGCQSQEDKLAEHKARGEQYMEDGQVSEAIIEYKNVLQIDPNDAEAHYELAKAYLIQNDLPKGFWELRETARLDPTNLDAKLQYGQLARAGGELEEALQQAEDVIAAEPERAPAWVLKGQVLERMDRIEEAEEAYRKGVELDAEDTAPTFLYADFLVRRGRSDEAEPYFRSLTEMRPDYSTYTALGSFLARDPEREAEAEEALLEAIAKADDEQRSAANRTLASFYYTKGRFDDAEQLLLDHLEQEPADLETIYALARFYQARGQGDEADAMVARATEAKPDDEQTWLILSAFRSRKGDLPGALAAAESAIERNPDSRTAKLRKAELLLDMGYREGAKEKIAQGRSITDAVLAADPGNPDALFVRSKIDLAEGRPKDAVTALRRAIELKPDWAQAHFLLGSALFVQGDRNAASAEVARALEIEPDFAEARKLIARIHAASGQADLAVDEGRRYLQRRPGDVEARLQLAQDLVRVGKLDEAMAELDRIPDEERSAEMQYARGRVHLMQEDAANARKALLRANELQPNHPEVLQALLQLDRAEGRLEDSRTRVEAALEAEPDSAALVHLEGIVAMLQRRPEDAEASFRRATELDPTDLAAYQSLASLLAATGRIDETIATYQRALETQPGSASLNMVLGSLYEAQGDTAKAMEYYDAAVQLDDSLAAAKNNLAYLLAEEGKDLDRALDLAQEAKSALPDNANAADTLGWVLYRKGVPGAAIGYLKDAEAGMNPNDPSLGLVRHHLALAYEANNEPQRARETLERAVEQLDALKAQAAERGANPQDPAWAGELRSMLERLQASAPASGGQG